VAKIAVVNVPFYSHIEAMLRLSAVLKRQGHSLIAWGPEAWRETIEGSGAAFVLHEPEMPRVVGTAGFVAALLAMTETRAEELIEQLFPLDVDLVLHDSQVPWARVAGDYLGIPRVVSHPMFPISTGGRILSEADRKAPTSDPEQAQEQFKASWHSIARRWGVELGDGNAVIHSARESEIVVAYTTRRIVGGYPLGDAWHCVGPLMTPAPQAVYSADRPLVYACFGTSFNARKEPFTAVIEGLADEPVDVLISTGNGTISAADFEPLPDNVAVRGFVPAREMLARASVHITHGGNNSVHECLMAGVPMLCMPQAYDQFPLSRAVELLGAGMPVDESPDAVARGVRRMLEDEAPRACARDIAEHLASYDGEGHVAALVEQALTDGAALVA